MISLTFFSGCNELKIFEEEDKEQDYLQERKVLEGIETITQGDKPWCAWASAQMVLKYYGYDFTQETIGQMTCKDTGYDWTVGWVTALRDEFIETIEKLSDYNLKIKPLSTTDKQDILDQIKNAINDDNPIIVISNGAWLFDYSWAGDIKWPLGAHASVIVGYSLSSREEFVKGLPFPGVQPPAIKLHDPAMMDIRWEAHGFKANINLIAYWLNYDTFFEKTTKENNFLILWRVG